MACSSDDADVMDDDMDNVLCANFESFCAPTFGEATACCNLGREGREAFIG